MLKDINKANIFIALVIATLLTVVGASLYVPVTHASEVLSRSITVSSSEVGATDVTYVLRFSTDPSGPAYNIGGLVVDFCDNSPIIGDPTCSVPAGFSINEAGLAIGSQSGVTGLTINANSDNNTIILTKNPATIINPNTTIRISLGGAGPSDGLINPNIGNHSFYARVYTYTTEAAAASYNPATPGAYTDAGGLALSTANAMDINSIVPPFLFFCAAQTINGYDCTTASELYVNFGDFSKNYTSTGLSQVLILTNAGSGYGVRLYGTTLTSGNNVIHAITLPSASNTGSEQFGINLVANTSPAVGNDPIGPGTAVPTVDYAVPNRFKYANGDTIISGAGVTSWRKFTISYVVNINNSQPPGIYTTTLTFICLANF